jgi:hypothetical protein
MEIPHIGRQLKLLRINNHYTMVEVCKILQYEANKKLSQPGLTAIESSCNFPRAEIFYSLLKIYKAGVASYEVEGVYNIKNIISMDYWPQTEILNNADSKA